MFLFVGIHTVGVVNGCLFCYITCGCSSSCLLTVLQKKIRT